MKPQRGARTKQVLRYAWWVSQRIRRSWLYQRHEPTDVLIAGYLTVWYLTNLEGAFFLDELIYIRAGANIFHANPYFSPETLFTPISRYLMGFGAVLFGSKSIGPRLPVVILAGIAVYFVYQLGYLVGNRVTATFSATLIGVT